MRKFTVTAVLVVILEIALIVYGAITLNGAFLNNSDRQYRVDAKRLVSAMREEDAIPDLSAYSSIVDVSLFDPEERAGNDYLVEEVNGELYRISYVSDNENRVETLKIFTVVGGISVLSTILVFVVVAIKIIRPFNKFTDIPVELAKGNLSMPIKENKSKLFGKYLWGMDQLRSNLEQNKEEELRLLKDKKTLVLSLSHDIKTPLSSIKLSARALAENLYDSEEKRKEVVDGIYRNAADIERYVGEIITASNEDFLNLTVNNSEFYLDDVMKSINEYYKDKLSVKHIDFEIEKYTNCLLNGDKDRVIEVIQNVIENAIKYGDGNYIKLSVSSEEDCKLIRIANSGEPIKDEEMPHLFDSFYRGTNVGSNKGSGLGLYIARKLMHMMDGEIFADNSSENEMAFVLVIHET